MWRSLIAVALLGGLCLGRCAPSHDEPGAGPLNTAPNPAKPLQFTVTCTPTQPVNIEPPGFFVGNQPVCASNGIDVAGGTLQGKGSGLTPGGRFTVRMTAPPNQDGGTSGTVNSDGSVLWELPLFEEEGTPEVVPDTTIAGIVSDDETGRSAPFFFKIPHLNEAAIS